MFSTSSWAGSLLLRPGASAVSQDGTGCVPDVTRGFSSSLAAPGAARVLPALCCLGIAPVQGWEIRAGLGFLPLTAPSQLVVREGELTASNYPGPAVMTLCPLQFPWDTVPLLPSSPELRGTRLASQNRPFFRHKENLG